MVMRNRLIMNGRNYRMTDDMRKVLAAVVDAAEPSWGFSICERAGVGSGVVYPVLERLMNAGVISAEWESPHHMVDHVGSSTTPCMTRRGTGRTGYSPRHLCESHRREEFGGAAGMACAGWAVAAHPATLRVAPPWPHPRDMRPPVLGRGVGRTREQGS